MAMTKQQLRQEARQPPGLTEDEVQQLAAVIRASMSPRRRQDFVTVAEDDFPASRGEQVLDRRVRRLEDS